MTLGKLLPVEESPKASTPEASAPLASAPLPEPATGVEKRVSLVCRDGVWEVEMWTSRPEVYFTEMDFNRLIRTLEAKRPLMRRQAALAYKRATKDLVAKNEQTKAAKSDAVRTTPVPTA